MDVIQVFDTVTGVRQRSIPASDWSWTEAVNDSGSLIVTIDHTEQSAGLNLRNLLQPWRTILAVVDTDTRRVSHAGPIYKRDYDADKRQLKVSCGGFLDLLKRRLVLNRAVKDFGGGIVTGSTQDGFPAAWMLKFTGLSLGDIARNLIAESLQFSTLPVVLPPIEGGTAERTYLGPDFATVADRIQDLCEVIGSPEIRFEPRINGRKIEFHMMHSTPELVMGTWDWDMRLPGTPIQGLTVNEDAADMTGDAWAKAGAQNDQTLIAHTRDDWLTRQGWPLLQMADSSHSTVSDLSTLTGYTQAMVKSRSTSLEVINFQVRRESETGKSMGSMLTAGDHVNLRVDDPYLGNTKLALKVLEVSGDPGEWVTARCRERME